MAIYAAGSGLVSLAVPLAAQSLVSSVAATGLVQPVLLLTSALFLALMLVGVLSASELRLTETLVVLFFRHSASRFAATKDLTAQRALRFYDTVVVQKSLATLLVDGPALVLQVVVGLTLLALYHPLFLTFSLGFVLCIVAFVALFAKRGEDMATVDLDREARHRAQSP